MLDLQNKVKASLSIPPSIPLTRTATFHSLQTNFISQHYKICKNKLNSLHFVANSINIPTSLSCRIRFWYRKQFIHSRLAIYAAISYNSSGFNWFKWHRALQVCLCIDWEWKMHTKWKYEKRKLKNAFNSKCQCSLGLFVQPAGQGIW